MPDLSELKCEGCGAVTIAECDGGACDGVPFCQACSDGDPGVCKTCLAAFDGDDLDDDDLDDDGPDVGDDDDDDLDDDGPDVGDDGNDDADDLDDDAAGAGR